MAVGLRLLVLCEYATLNGGEQSLLATLPATLADGWEVVVALPAEGPLNERLRELGVTRVPLELRSSPAESASRRPLAEIRTQLAALFKRTQPALVHANSLSMGRISGPVTQALKVPAVAHLRDIVRLSAAAIADLNCNDRLIAVSVATRDAHVAAGIDAAKTVVLYNGVCLQSFQPRPATGYLHRELSLDAGAPLIAAIGQLGLRKDPLTFLRAAQQVLQAHPQSHFLLIGARNSAKQESKDYEEQLRRLATQPSLAGHVHFLGTRSDISRLLAELTLVVHTARQEPLGRVLLEAGAAGKVIIASDVGGTREIFPPGSGAARLFPAGDERHFAAHMSQLLKLTKERQEMAIRARKRIAEHFDIRDRAAELLKVYREIVADAN